ncbi:hypothetical protein [Bdellovibrio sp. HCB337]|uniref:hypothetical protein n=1 Tax=Bdellovibrio sp. HCB337 TaxID=3394358 RepID=UPI0039A773AC
MRTTSLRAARRDARSICTKGECNIVNLSSPEEIKNLSEAQLKRQILLSRRAFQKHRDNYKRMSAASKRSRLGVGGPHKIQLKMSLMEDSQRRFERQLKLFKAKAIAKAAARSSSGRSKPRVSARSTVRASGRRGTAVRSRSRVARPGSVLRRAQARSRVRSAVRARVRDEARANS